MKREELKRDHRNLFMAKTSRKACYWRDVNKPSTDFFTPERVEALNDLPVIYVGPNVTPFSDIFVHTDGIEYLLVVEPEEDESEPEVYYVNTEGYSYARYALYVPYYFCAV